MANKIRALLLQDGQSTYTPELHRELRAQAVEVQLAGSCEDFRALVTSPDPPELIFTDLKLSDGTWEEVVQISQGASLPVNVIVVSRLVNIRLYTEVLQKGAFDFITPPFHASELSHVVRSAFGNAAKKRSVRSRNSVQSGLQGALLPLAIAG